ncbi:MAG: hypothetical protein JWO32_875 [Bacteroidetes bacterium]|nr:hypothetical protein [Bacteroidota bacterium]
MKNRVTTFVFLFLTLAVFSQNENITFFNDFNFIIHLSKNKLFKEAEFERGKLFKQKDIATLYKDSINFFLGQAYYNDNKPESARKHFMEVSEQPFFYYKARYLAGMIDAEMERVDSSITNFVGIGLSTSEDLNELRSFELAGMALLKKRYGVFDSIMQVSQFKNPLIRSEGENLKNYCVIDKKIKRKSAFVAGALSTIIPGLGKVYVGNNAQGLAAFLTCGLMGAIAAENYIHLGIEHPQTLFFAGMFTLFYVGNIWGSAVSVQLVKIEKQFENKHNILVGLKLPVSKFFN